MRKAKDKQIFRLAFAGLATVNPITKSLNFTFFGLHNVGMIRHLITDASSFLELNFLHKFFIYEKRIEPRFEAQSLSFRLN
nr:hypothetical protein BAU18_01925 [Enterococcus diestrammenae]